MVIVYENQSNSFPRLRSQPLQPNGPTGQEALKLARSSTRCASLTKLIFPSWPSLSNPDTPVVIISRQYIYLYLQTLSKNTSLVLCTGNCNHGFPSSEPDFVAQVLLEKFVGV